MSKGAAMFVLAVILGSLGLATPSGNTCRIGVAEEIPWGLPWYHVAVFGDNRPGDVSSTHYPRVYLRLIEELGAIRPFGVIGTGDHTGHGSRAQINAFMESLSNTSNVWVIEGNHDIGSSSDLAYWHRVIAPPMYYVDSLPGWRIVFFSTEIPWDQYGALQSFLSRALATNRSVVLVFHRPLYPRINYNMGERMADIVWRAIKDSGNVRLVLQGHWHGFLEARRNDTLFVVTAGAGAPLYQPEGRHHYVILIFSNRGFSLIPVSLEEGGLRVENRGQNRIAVLNHLRAINGSPITVPVRIRLRGTGVYAVLQAPQGETELTYDMRGDIVEARLSRPAEWYIYAPTEPKARVNYTANSTMLLLSVEGLAPYTVTSTCTETETITVSRPVYRTITVTVSRMQDSTSPCSTMFSTSTSFTTITIQEGGGGVSSATAALILVIFMVVCAASILACRRRGL